MSIYGHIKSIYGCSLKLRYQYVSCVFPLEVVLNEDVMNSYLTWSDKYQPTKARFVIGDRGKIKNLFTWLNAWKERHESIIKKMAARANKRLVYVAGSFIFIDWKDRFYGRI